MSSNQEMTPWCISRKSCSHLRSTCAPFNQASPTNSTQLRRWLKYYKKTMEHWATRNFAETSCSKQMRAEIRYQTFMRKIPNTITAAKWILSCRLKPIKMVWPPRTGKWQLTWKRIKITKTSSFSIYSSGNQWPITWDRKRLNRTIPKKEIRHWIWNILFKTMHSVR